MRWMRKRRRWRSSRPRSWVFVSNKFVVAEYRQATRQEQTSIWFVCPMDQLLDWSWTVGRFCVQDLQEFIDFLLATFVFVQCYILSLFVERFLIGFSHYLFSIANIQLNAPRVTDWQRNCWDRFYLLFFSMFDLQCQCQSFMRWVVNIPSSVQSAWVWDACMISQKPISNFQTMQRALGNPDEKLVLLWWRNRSTGRNNNQGTRAPTTFQSLSRQHLYCPACIFGGGGGGASCLSKKDEEKGRRRRRTISFQALKVFQL